MPVMSSRWKGELCKIRLISCLWHMLIKLSELTQPCQFDPQGGLSQCWPLTLYMWCIRDWTTSFLWSVIKYLGSYGVRPSIGGLRLLSKCSTTLWVFKDRVRLVHMSPSPFVHRSSVWVTKRMFLPIRPANSIAQSQHCSWGCSLHGNHVLHLKIQSTQAVKMN